MSFANLSGLGVALGVAGLAAGLFLLQRLRVRYQPKRVITTLFWKEALEEARARVLVRRFRHLLAYLFVLLIASLLWLGFADPQWGESEDADYVILVDGSAGMAYGDRFEEAIEAARAHAAALPRDRRAVLLCGSRIRTLLLPGEHERVLDRRVDGITPDACPATVETALRAISHAKDTGRTLNVVVAGDAPVRDETDALLPSDVTVSRLTTTSARDGNRGITALGVVPASSGAWDRVDVLAELHGETAGLAISVGGAPLAANAARVTTHGQRRQVSIRDLPARGSLLEITLPGGDPLSLDDVARIRLPKRPRLKVALSPSLSDVLEPVLAADPGIAIVASGADVAVRRGGESTGGEIPALEWTRPDSQVEAILLHHERGLQSERVLVESFDRLGLEDVDTSDLAARTGRVISLGAAPADRRGVGVWDTLLGAQYNFVHSRSFPLFVAASLRWLAGTTDFAAFVAAGEPIRGDATPRRDAAGRTLDPVGAAFVPPVAGAYASDADELVASLLSPETTTGSAIAASDASASVASSGGADALTIIALVALGLLLMEWFLYRTGRMP